jgi:hypothetical protein
LSHQEQILHLIGEKRLFGGPMSVENLLNACERSFKTAYKIVMKSLETFTTQILFVTLFGVNDA